ncbi:MAG: RloB domain-containing protein [Rivularia sp. (in: cyanobacteria)]
MLNVETCDFFTNYCIIFILEAIFQFINTGIPRSDYIKKLKSLLSNKYQKNSETIYDELFEKQLTAIKHATTLLKQYNPHNPVDDNPSTTVHLLVQ